MGLTAQSVHPSLQRYLPGHLPKRQRRLYTGKNNRKEFEVAHLDDVESEVAQHLTLPSRLAQSLLPSPTVTRAAVIVAGETRLGANNGCRDSPWNSRTSEQVPLRSRRHDGAAQVRETAMTLLASNTAGTEQYFTEETFYFGGPNLGGAGQVEYNDPSEPHSRNAVVSAWNARAHFSPSLWFARATQHPPDAAPQTQVSRSFSAHATNGSQRKGTTDAKSAARGRDAETQLPCTEIQPNASTGCPTEKTSCAWPYSYAAPDLYAVPPPKLRFELTDYHATFHHTSGVPNSSMYISENDRLQSIQKVPLPTPTNIALYTPARRRYPAK
ncbi:uncharacterized protein Tco025E_08734 [Trypanosoma conorhini]|uniref:Uncharacterized protein n=1 Tax=Trypanosoma conorhini TaxID=83891 RepID=A0A422N5Q5_9TRYP|nr:uncharacterized protein Tco025E_08734 [Trypanosoma conorhini]RNF00789.1 hypothetical protein Tco025E_08734 [Trypanosoma conorhini]